MVVVVVVVVVAVVIVVAEDLWLWIFFELSELASVLRAVWLDFWATFIDILRFLSGHTDYEYA